MLALSIRVLIWRTSMTLFWRKIRCCKNKLPPNTAQKSCTRSRSCRMLKASWVWLRQKICSLRNVLKSSKANSTLTDRNKLMTRWRLLCALKENPTMLVRKDSPHASVHLRLLALKTWIMRIIGTVTPTSGYRSLINRHLFLSIWAISSPRIRMTIRCQTHGTPLMTRYSHHKSRTMSVESQLKWWSTCLQEICRKRPQAELE